MGMQTQYSRREFLEKGLATILAGGLCDSGIIIINPKNNDSGMIIDNFPNFDRDMAKEPQNNFGSSGANRPIYLDFPNIDIISLDLLFIYEALRNSRPQTREIQMNYVWSDDFSYLESEEGYIGEFPIKIRYKWTYPLLQLKCTRGNLGKDRINLILGITKSPLKTKTLEGKIGDKKIDITFNTLVLDENSIFVPAFAKGSIGDSYVQLRYINSKQIPSQVIEICGLVGDDLIDLELKNSFSGRIGKYQVETQYKEFTDALKPKKLEGTLNYL